MNTDLPEHLARLAELAAHGPDPAVEVERLCTAHPEHAPAIRRRVAEAGPDTDWIRSRALPPRADDMPAEIGPFRVLRLLGSGGMGVVYLAQQDRPVSRLVALKVIKLGMDSRAVIRRFEQERQALAVMNHDAIARVLDAGTTPRGQPWFAMELVEGTPINDYCDEQRLSLNERIALMQQVCAGVHHAHQKGVIHRDLKPGNILVARQGNDHVAKVIDFGIARATESTPSAAETMQGSLLGTPEYMSPEQAAGDRARIDIRTDIYSLGVVLYELLTGELPIDGDRLPRDDLVELRRVICEEDPPLPSIRLAARKSATTNVAHARRTTLGDLRRHVAGDLDWIVLKAIAKQAEDRYGSASELAADLQRYLDLEPVVAGPPTTSYRLRKFVRRNRVAVAVGALFAFTLIAGTVGTSIGLSLANENARLAGQREVVAIDARASAERALRSLHEICAWFVTDFHDRIEGLPGSTQARRELVDKGLAYLEVLGRESQSDFDAELQIAIAYTKIGRVQGWPHCANLADPEGALANLDRAEQILVRLSERRPDDGRVSLLLIDLFGIRTDIFRARNEVAVAAASQRRAFDLASQLPASPVKQRILFRLELSAGALMMRAANVDEAERHYDAALAMLAGQEPASADRDESEHVLDVVMLHAAIGQLHGNPFMPDRWDPERGVDHFTKSLAALESLIAKAPYDPFLRQMRADLQAKLARVHGATGRTDNALALLQGAIADSETLLAIDPSDFGNLLPLANQYEALGIVRRDMDQLDESIAAFDKAVAAIARLCAADTTNRSARRYHATLLEACAKVHGMRGDVEALRRTYESALAVWRQLEKDAESTAAYDAREVLPALHRYAVRLRALRESAAAREIDRQCVALAEHNLQQRPDDDLARADVSAAYSALATGLIAELPDAGDVAAQVAAWTEIRRSWQRCKACLEPLARRNALESAEEQFFAGIDELVAGADRELERLARQLQPAGRSDR